MENERNEVSFQVHEADMARMERANNRILIALIAVITALLLNNVVWIVYTYNTQSKQVIYETEKVDN